MTVPPGLQSITLDLGPRISYLACGLKHGEPILLIHGLANYLWAWKWTLDALQENYCCIAVDLPGNGFSSRDSYPYSIPFYAACLLEMSQKLGWKNFRIAGHSMGGQIALQMALMAPEKVRQLLLIAPAGLEYFSPQVKFSYRSLISLGKLFPMDEQQIAQSIQAGFYRPVKHSQQMIDDLTLLIRRHDRVAYRRMLEQCIESMIEHTLLDDLAQIQSHTVIIFGEQDQIIPNRFLQFSSTRQLALKGAALIPNAEAILIPDAGHFVHIEKANEVNQILKDRMCRVPANTI